MGWNYRVIKIANKKDLIERFNCEPYYYQIMETYYDEQGEPNGFGDAALISETYETLNNNLKLIKEAFSKPVIIVNENFMVTGYENNNKREMYEHRKL